MKMDFKIVFFLALCLGGVASRHPHPRAGGVASRHPHPRAVILKSNSGLPTLPSLDQFLGASSKDLTSGEFYVSDGCDATVSKADAMYQISSNPVNCMNFANLLNLILPEDKGNFAMDSPGFMTLENIIIASLSFNNATKMVDIAASYSGTVSIIPRILSISDIYLHIEFTSTHSDSWMFDISASVHIGSVDIDVSIVRNDEGYFLSASTEESISASDIANIFNTGDSLLPATGLEDKLEAANLNTFSIGRPRISAVFTEGWGFMFGGKISILSWDPFDVNLLVNKPNDSPLSITIALYTPTFLLSKMFSDLFDMDVRSVPVIGEAEIQNLALVISTQEVETPLVFLDLGYTDMFDLPYRKGVTATFDITIIDALVSISVLITPDELRLTVSQSDELTLRKVVDSFLADETSIVSGEGDDSSLDDWPKFIGFDPLAISLSLFDIAAAKDKEKGWGMSSFEIKLKMTEPITFFEDLIRITDLTFDMTWSKTESGSEVAGLIAGKVVIGSEANVSPSVDVRIPFPFANEEVTFTFTDFSIHNVATAFGFNLPAVEFLTQLELNNIALAFNDEGKLNKLTVKAGIPDVWPIFGDFSIGKLTFFVEIDNMANSPDRKWLFRVTGHLIIASCDIFVSATLGSDIVKILGEGPNCGVSIHDLLNAISVNPDILPSLITGFTLSAPVFSFRYDRTSPKRSVGFGATTSLFGSSDAEVAFVSDNGTSAIVAGFAVQTADAVPGIGFLNDLGLSDMAVMYVSKRITMEPYEWGKPIFNNYAPTNKELDSGLTLYARFVPTPTNMMGKLLGQAGSASIEVSLTFPNLVFKLDIKLGKDGIPLGDGGGRFISMGVEISRQLVGLNLVFALRLDKANLTFTGKLSFTFGGTVTISLLLDGVWKEPLGIKNFEVHRLGLALGINLLTLLPSFGLTGEILVSPPGRDDIEAGLTICIDVANPLSTVFEVHFSRLLLQDIANVFMDRIVPLPPQIGEMGFPNEVRIFISLAGNLDCFGRAYDAGVEISGTFQIPFLQVYASADIVVKLDPFQLKADLNLSPINYGNGLLKIVSAQSDSVGAYLKMNIGNSDEFLINGSCRVVLFGASISIRLEIDKERLSFDGRLNLWNLFQVELKVDLEYGGSSPSLHVVGTMQNDLFTKIKQRATQGIKNGARIINQKIESAQVKIRNAQKEVDSLWNSIRYHQKKIEEAKRDCSRAPWYSKIWVCIGAGGRIVYHGVIIGGIWIAWGVATGILKLADLFLKGVKELIKVAASVLSALVNAILSIIDIQYVKFEVFLSSTTKIFKFNAKIVILGWTFEPSFDINFSSSSSAEGSINAAGDTISKSTLDKVE